MGLAASQARLLSITSRLSDNELRTQLINNSKMRLATESSRVSEDYINALNSATMMMTNYDIDGNEQTQALTFNALTSYSPSNNQYGLVDTNGRILVNGNEARLFEQSGGNLDSYLASHGLKYTTSYFNNSTFGDWYNAETGKVDLKLEQEDGELVPYASYSVEELEAMYLGDTITVDGLEKTYPSYEASYQSAEYFNYLEKYQAYDTAVTDYVNDYWYNLNSYVNKQLLGYDTSINSLEGQNYKTAYETGGWLGTSLTGNYTTNVPSFDGGQKLDAYRDSLTSLASALTPSGSSLKNDVDAILSGLGYTVTEDHVYHTVDAPANAKVHYKTILSSTKYVDYIEMGPTNVRFDGIAVDKDGQTIDQSPDNNNLSVAGISSKYSIVVSDTGLTATVVKVHMENRDVIAFGGKYDETADNAIGVQTNGKALLNVEDASKYTSKNPLETSNITYNGYSARITNISNGVATVTFGYKDAENKWVDLAWGKDANDNLCTTAYIRLKSVYNDDTEKYEYFLDPNDKNLYSSVNLDEGNKIKGGIKVWDDDTFNNDVESYSLDHWKYLQTFTYITDNGDMYKIVLDDVPKNNGSSTIGQTVYKYVTGDEIIAATTKMKEYFMLHLDDSQDLFNISEAQRIMKTCGATTIGDAYFKTLKETVFQYLDSVFVTKDADGNVLTGRDADGNFVGDGYQELYNALWQDADKIGDIKWILANYGGNPKFQEILENNDTFNSIKKQGVLEQLFDTFGEPKMGWIDTWDNNSDGTRKAEWYTNLFNKMKDGYKVLEQGLTGSKDWIQYALESGLATVVQVDKARNWTGAGYKNIKEITEVVDDKAVAVAEAQYNKAMNDIENKDKRFDMELKNIDTEHNALQQEYETIKSVISKNVERTFKIYS